jgi:hypothetical protein
MTFDAIMKGGNEQPVIARAPGSGESLLQSCEEKERGECDDRWKSGGMDHVTDEMCQRRAWSTSVTQFRSVKEHRHVGT